MRPWNACKEQKPQQEECGVMLEMQQVVPPATFVLVKINKDNNSNCTLYSTKIQNQYSCFTVFYVPLLKLLKSRQRKQGYTLKRPERHKQTYYQNLSW